MMIVKTDYAKYQFPVTNGLNIIVDNQKGQDVLENLNLYFFQKKKTKCQIFDDEKDIIQPKEFEFIYLPPKENVYNNFEIKNRTVLSSYLENAIYNNPEMFLTIDLIRNNLHSLCTDLGMYNLLKVLTKDLGISLSYDLTNFNVASLLEMMAIISNDIEEAQMYAAIYNVLLYAHKESNKIVYIDFAVSNSISHWIERIAADKKNIIIINSSSIISKLDVSKCSVIIMGSYDLVSHAMSVRNLNLFIYMMKPFVQNNLEFQKEENIKFIDDLIDTEATYLINFG